MRKLGGRDGQALIIKRAIRWNLYMVSCYCEGLRNKTSVCLDMCACVWMDLCLCRWRYVHVLRISDKCGWVMEWVIFGRQPAHLPRHNDDNDYGVVVYCCGECVCVFV